MKRISIIFVVALMLFFMAFHAFAWTDDDYNNGVNMPLLQPILETRSGFAIDPDVPDHNGNKGNVYRGNVSVAKHGAETNMVNLNSYPLNEGKYKLSLWFMEEENGCDPMTRMIRPKVVNDTIKNGSTYLFYTGWKKDVTQGKWIYATLDFVVNSSENSFCLTTNSIGLWWNCADSWDNETYESRNHSGNYYVCISDIQLVKYPSETLSFAGTNDGDSMKATSSSFNAFFSHPIDASSVENITVDGTKRDPKNFSFFSERNATGNSAFKISPFGGFAPGKSYEVRFSGVKDIFGRKYEDEISGTISVQDYLIAKKVDSHDEQKLALEIKNNMSESAAFAVVVFWYSGNNVKYTSYSQEFRGLMPNETITAEIQIPAGTDGLKAKAQIWNYLEGVPIPISAEFDI